MRGRYGIEEAARYYFGKPAREVSLAEGAMLAGLPPVPSSTRRATTRPARKPGARSCSRRCSTKASSISGNTTQRWSSPFGSRPAVEPQGQLAPEVVEIVKRTLKEAIGETQEGAATPSRPPSIPKMQAAARKAVRDNLDAYDKRYKLLGPFAPPVSASRARRSPSPPRSPSRGRPGSPITRCSLGRSREPTTPTGSARRSRGDRGRGASSSPITSATIRSICRRANSLPEGTLLRVSLWRPPTRHRAPKVPLRLELGPEGAMVALDVRTREVLALVGNYEAASGALDRVTQAHRQPGSSFKPFVYSYGVYSRRFTPATMLDTNPGTLTGYRPSNFEDSEGSAPMRLREALAHSVNVAAVHVLQDVGPANVVSWANALGIQSKLGADFRSRWVLTRLCPSRWPQRTPPWHRAACTLLRCW